MKNEIFEYENNFFEIKQQKYEVRDIYLERVWFILHNINNYKCFDELEKISKIWSNEKIFSCHYE